MSAKLKAIEGGPKIEKGIPIPPKGTRGPQLGNTKTSLLRKMDVGDSIEVAGGRDEYNSYHSIARSAGIKIAVRQVSPDKFRLWRVA
jgi:hypothetical protein